MLEKLFIKDYKNTADAKVRVKYGLLASLFGIITNIVLFIGKIFVGIFSASIAIISDAINNLSDGVSSIMSFVGFKLSAKPADKQHPFGHARYEYITGLLVAFLICIIGVLLCKSSIEKIISPEEIIVNLTVCLILFASILIKLAQVVFYKRTAKAISSETIKANAIDARNDILVTTATLFAMIIIWLTGLNIDGYVGLGVSIFVIISGVKILISTINPLLGEVPNQNLVMQIKNKLNSYEDVLGTHELVLHSYGASKYFASVHLEISADISPIQSHELIEKIEQDFFNEFGIYLVIHTDPVENNNKQVLSLKNNVEEVLQKLSSELSLYDFRIIKGETHTNLIFDIIAPLNSTITKQEIETELNKTMNSKSQKYVFIFDITKNIFAQY